MTSLDKALLEAHTAQDALELVRLYAAAADQVSDVNAACFFLTHAYVFALETGHPDTETLRLRLVAEGREPAQA